MFFRWTDKIKRISLSAAVIFLSVTESLPEALLIKDVIMCGVSESFSSSIKTYLHSAGAMSLPVSGSQALTDSGCHICLETL